MQVINRNKNIFKIKITNPEDLWYLTMIIDKGDFIRGKTYRKINLNSKDEKTNVVKKVINVKISVEKINYDPESRLLRIGGLIVESSDPDISNNVFQSLTIEENTIFTLEKKVLYKFQEEKIKEAEETQEKILLVIHDREKALFVVLNNYESKVILEMNGNVQRKDVDVQSNNFYKEIAKKLEEESKKLNVNTIILASPSFFKEYVIEFIENKNNVILATCSSVTKNAIQEILKRDEIKQALSKQRLAKETKEISYFFSAMSKEDPIAYGVEDVDKAAQVGAIKKLYLTDKLLQENKENETFDKIENIMKLTQQAEGEIMIIATTHEDGLRFHKMGGIGALLRYKIN